MKYTFILLFPLLGLSQNDNSVVPFMPKNAKIGECYVMLFDFDKKIDWEKVHCDSIPGRKLTDGIKWHQKIGNKTTKEYQTKLISLGYDLSVNGLIDKKTADAHHKYLKDKTKAEKKAARKRKKELKDSLKQVKLQNKHLQKEL